MTEVGLVTGVALPGSNKNLTCNTKYDKSPPPTVGWFAPGKPAVVRPYVT